MAAGGAELVWHRGDLRLHDHAALHAAASAPGGVAAVVVLDPAILDHTSPRRRALFQENVRALRASYAAIGGRLYVRRGRPADVLPELAAALGVSRAHALRSYTPYGMLRDTETAAALELGGVRMHFHAGLYIHEPGTVLTRAAAPFSVYGPFARRWQELGTGAEHDAPRALQPPAAAADEGDVPDDDEPSFVPLPEPGERAALDRLERFIEERLDDYADARNRLDGSGSSRLSIDLTLGTLSARTVLNRVQARGGEGARRLVGELIWRDFMGDLLHHRPHLVDTAFDPRFERLEWNDDDDAFEAWSTGNTGIPVVDAAMRELRGTGWISNRARMVAAQFLTKHLRIDWRRGEKLFRDLLLDGDRASNVGNWQWAAGLGVDNAPYFRVFNPVTQGKEHDPGGHWLRRWAPESNGDPRALPYAIVDLAQARREYLAAVEAL